MLHDVHPKRPVSPDPRAAFTLVEMLVVVAIVGIIVALSAAAAVQILAYARGSNTRTTIQTLDTLFKRHWSAVVQQANKEKPHDAILAMAGNDPSRAQVIWVKMRLKQEFPMNFTEALFPWLLPPALNTPQLAALNPIHQTPQPPGNFADPNWGPNVLAAKPAYARALTAAGIFFAGAPPQAPPGTPVPTFPTLQTPRDWPDESGVLLLLALMQNRTGATAISNEDLGSLAVANYFAADVTGASRDTGLKSLTDGWGKPLSFYRWPTATPIPYDFNPNPPPQTPVFGPSATDPLNSNNNDVDNSFPGGTSVVFRDTDDPQGALVNPNWNNGPSWGSQGGVFWFEAYCHSVHFVQPTYTAKAYFTVPVIVSSGRNGLRGYAQPPLLLFPNPSPLLPDPMCFDAYPDPGNVGYHDASNDNLLSYRLRQGAKGE